MPWLHRHKHLVLLLTLGCTYVVQSTARGFGGGPVLPKILSSAVVFAVLLVVFERLRSRIVALTLALASLATTWIHYAVPAAQIQLPLSIAHYAVNTAFLGYAVAVILGNIFRRSGVDADHVLGAVAGYLIAGAAWSSLYSLTYTLVPDAFTMPPVFGDQLPDWPGRTAVFNYFSIVTLTTMGYGDITPARAPATAFAMIEAVFGQFYIAVVVAQLVGARLSGQMRPQSTDSQINPGSQARPGTRP